MRIACVCCIARATGTKDAKSLNKAEDMGLLNLKTRERRLDRQRKIASRIFFVMDQRWTSEKLILESYREC